MFLNGYAVLCVFLSLARMALAVIVVVIGLSAVKSAVKSSGVDQKQSTENRVYLLFLMSSVMIGLNFLSWPIFYLLLQSYVDEWPAAMCIYGVTQIGAGTPGVSRFLPVLVDCLLWTKPVLIFASGASYVLYLINRRTQTSPILHRVLMSLVLAGTLTIVDSAVETTYLAIPNDETRVAGGCCTNTLESLRKDSQFTPQILVGEEQRPVLRRAYYGLNLTMIVGLILRLALGRRSASTGWNRTLYVCGLFTVPVSLLFLVEIASPKILGLPFHHCPYDLVEAAPESIVGVVLFAGGLFCLGWSFVAETQKSSPETVEVAHDYVSGLLFLAWFGYTGSLLLISIELSLSR